MTEPLDWESIQNARNVPYLGCVKLFSNVPKGKNSISSTPKQESFFRFWSVLKPFEQKNRIRDGAYESFQNFGTSLNKWIHPRLASWALTNAFYKHFFRQRALGSQDKLMASFQFALAWPQKRLFFKKRCVCCYKYFCVFYQFWHEIEIKRDRGDMRCVCMSYRWTFLCVANKKHFGHSSSKYHFCKSWHFGKSAVHINSF